MLKKHLLTFICLLLALFLCPQAKASPKINADIILQEGVNQAIFSVEEAGKIIVYLPSELAPLDVFSGSLKYKPAGQNKIEKEKNLKELETYKVEIRRAEILPSKNDAEDSKKVPPPEASSTEPYFEGIIPDSAKSLEVTLFKGEKKTKYCKLKLSDLKEGEAPPQGTCFIPAIAQAGHPVVIKGTFDGLSKNTSVTIGSVKAKIQAESPKEVVFESPQHLVGKTTLLIEENDKMASSQIVNLKLRLVANKSEIMMGEKTTLKVNIAGVNQTNEAMELVIDNTTPDIVSVSGGNQQVVRIPAGGRK